MIRHRKHSLGFGLLFVMLLLFVVLPLVLLSLLYLGFPPVIGNLTSAQALKKYAAQVHPEWEAQGNWAGFNLVSGRYSLTFSTDTGEQTLEYGSATKLVEDTAREEAFLTEFGVDRVIQVNRLWIPGQLTTFCNVHWSPQDPKSPHVSLRSDLYVNANPGEEAMREELADVGITLSQTFSPLFPIHTLSVQYGFLSQEENCYIWRAITVEPEEGVSLTREALLAAPFTAK
ncbi:MAG: hypothetical protein ACOX7N_00070 [Lawsonibacter sp.]